MKKSNDIKKINKYFIFSIVLISIFFVFTILVKAIDVKMLGESNTKVGFAWINDSIYRFFEQSKTCNTLTNIILYFSLLVAIFFCLLLAYQMIRKKGFFKADRDLYGVLTCLLITVLFYIIFEILVINNRPVLVDGQLEASYPSSHVLFGLVSLGLAINEINLRIKNKYLKLALICVCVVLMSVLPVLRVFSGMHWLTDIIGATLLSLSIVMLQFGIVGTK